MGNHSFANHSRWVIRVLSVAILMGVAILLAGGTKSTYGKFEIVRLNQSGELGQGVTVSLHGPVSTSHVFKSAARNVLKVPVGWYQVNCNPIGQTATTHSRTLLVQAGKSTMVRCFFPKATSTEDIAAHKPTPSLPTPAGAKKQGEMLLHGPLTESGLSGVADALRIGRGGGLAPTGRTDGAAVGKLGGRPARKSAQLRGRSMLAYRFAGSVAVEPKTNHNTENYDRISEGEFRSVVDSPLSTVSIDVDTAAYANSRRFIQQMNRLPPKDAVRIEEFINYFNYDYAQPESEHPFSIHTEVSVAPWNTSHRLVHVGLQGKKIDMSEAPASNLVFLIDVSGSMGRPNKLPLLVKGFKLLVNQLRDQDRVAIVVYAGSAGLVLPSTPGSQKEKILGALDGLRSGGSTAGGAGIRLAYKTARDNFIEGGTNRVILATDGDFNVGVSSTSELERMVETQRKSNVFLTILGFGRGNYKDARMETLSNKGNGNAAYIDSIQEAKKVLVKEMGGTLVTIAKDVKIQIEFNPAKVKGYRLIGYENRRLAARDFNDDTKDAGELGAGHTVTALYEIIPAGSSETIGGVDPLKYQTIRENPTAQKSPELLTVKLRYKQPSGSKSTLISQPLIDHEAPLAKSSNAFRFSAAVAEFGMLLRESTHRGDASYAAVIERATGALGADRDGYRKSFIRLVSAAKVLSEASARND